MQQIIVSCPKCGASIDLTQAVQEDLVRAVQEEAREELQKTHSMELEELHQQLESKNTQLSEARKFELKLRQQQRELDERIENQDLEIERRLGEERKQIAKDTREKIEGEYLLKLAQKDIQLERVIEELDAAKRKAEQGSQQLQGEVAELNLESILSCSFPHDLIEPVGKGVRGADIHQRVRTPDGQLCGIIIWESKNTKNWNDRWLSKLKDDQLGSKADLAVIVSTVLPEDISNFAYIDGIWVTGFPYVLGLATAFRDTLIQVAKARRSAEGKDEKIELLFRYLSGPEFKQRVEMVVTTFITMKSDLDKERLAMTKLWSQREKCIEKVTGSVAGMYGDLQGIVGAALPSISALELPEEVE